MASLAQALPAGARHQHNQQTSSSALTQSPAFPTFPCSTSPFAGIRRGLIGSEPLFGSLCTGHLERAVDDLAQRGRGVSKGPPMI